MDFADRIAQLSAQAKSSAAQIQTEEATKNALVMPFIQALGYNVFDLNEVNPELNADVGVKKGEKVDYAIMRDGKPAILFECKTAGTNLKDAHISQLYRYFSVTDARFAVLTNGTEYWFYTDLDAPNRMDAKPFLIFNLFDYESRVEDLKKFTKDTFDLGLILSTASQLKYTNEIKRLFTKQLTDPDEEFVLMFARQVYSGKVMAGVKDQFTKLVKVALQQWITDQISARLKAVSEMDSQPIMTEEDEDGNRVETTIEEHEAYLVVRAILREVVDVKRVIMRDTQSYCGVLLDDNNRKPICRIHFNSKQKYIGVIDAQKNEERIAITGIDDIYKHADRIKAAVAYYD